MGTKRRQRSQKKCEFCSAALHRTSKDTVCDACDSALEVEQTSSALHRATLYALKHKCVECDAGLTEDRARLCIKCMPDAERETEDAYTLYVEDVGDVHSAVAVSKTPHVGKSKECTSCKEDLPLERFYKSPSGKFGRQSKCVQCLATLRLTNEMYAELDVVKENERRIRAEIREVSYDL